MEKNYDDMLNSFFGEIEPKEPKKETPKVEPKKETFIEPKVVETPKEQPKVVEQPKQQQVQVKQKQNELVDSVTNRVLALQEENKLNLPKNYSVGNALNSAWLQILQTKDKNLKPATQVCTKTSIANAMLEMAIMGQNPAKTQGYFIVYGDQLQWFPSYFGKCASLKRIKGIETEPIGTLIYDGDKITLGHNELGEEVIKDHETTWENKMKGKIVGAYATVFFKGIKRSAVMTREEINECWNAQKLIKGYKVEKDETKNKFVGEFCKRTVINRVTKMILKTSNDDDLLIDTIIENEERHYDFNEPSKETQFTNVVEAQENANKKVASEDIIDIDENSLDSLFND